LQSRNKDSGLFSFNAKKFARNNFICIIVLSENKKTLSNVIKINQNVKIKNQNDNAKF